MIVSDWDSKFTSKFWCETHKLLGTKLLISTLFHPQMDSASKCTIWSVAQILRVMVQPDQRNWMEKVPMVEFALNSAISSSSRFAPFKLTYGYHPSMNPGITPELSSTPEVRHFVAQALQNLTNAHDAIIESRVRQTHNANWHQREDNSFAVGDLVYVSTADLSLLKGRASKLLLKYVSPFKVIDTQPNTSNYKIELLTQLRAWNLHDQFHWSRLQPHHANDNMLFPHREANMFYDFRTLDDQEWLVEEILAHKWDKKKLAFQVHWNMGDTTWETLHICKDLQALDAYLQLIGVEDPLDLPWWDMSWR